MDGSIIGFYSRQGFGGCIEALHQVLVRMAFGTQRHDFLAGAGCLFSQPMHDMPVSLGDAFFEVAIKTTAQRLGMTAQTFRIRSVKRVLVAEFAIGPPASQLGWIRCLGCMDAGIVKRVDLPVRKISLGKGRRQVTDGGTIDILGDGTMGNFGDVNVALPAGDLPVEAAVIDPLVYMEVPQLPGLVHKAQ
jgi:hypothetical protein